MSSASPRWTPARSPCSCYRCMLAYVARMPPRACACSSLRIWLRFSTSATRIRPRPHGSARHGADLQAHTADQEGKGESRCVTIRVAKPSKLAAPQSSLLLMPLQSAGLLLVRAAALRLGQIKLYMLTTACIN
jgi:hypothetical protein